MKEEMEVLGNFLSNRGFPSQKGGLGKQFFVAFNYF